MNSLKNRTYLYSLLYSHIHGRRVGGIYKLLSSLSSPHKRGLHTLLSVVYPQPAERERRVAIVKHLMTTVLVCTTFTTFAQNSALLQKFRAANTTLNIGYDYKLVLRNTNTKRNVDSTRGRLWVKEGQYIDSNTLFFTARVGEYFCKLDFSNRTAIICNMPQLAKKTGARLVNDQQKYIFNLTDSLLSRQGNYTIDILNANLYRLKMAIKNYPITYIQIDFRRDNYKMVAVYTESNEQDESQHVYITKMNIYNIKELNDDKLFNLNRIFTINNTKPTLTNKFSKYTLVPVE